MNYLGCFKQFMDGGFRNPLTKIRQYQPGQLLTTDTRIVLFLLDDKGADLRDKFINDAHKYARVTRCLFHLPVVFDFAQLYQRPFQWRKQISKTPKRIEKAEYLAPTLLLYFFRR